MPQLVVFFLGLELNKLEYLTIHSSMFNMIVKEEKIV